MAKRQRKKSPVLEVSFDITNPKAVQADSSDESTSSFTRVYTSLVKLKDYVPPVPAVEVDKLKTLILTLLQVDQGDLSGKGSGINATKGKKESNMFYVDLNKIENMSLRNGDKKKLKCILEHIKCEAPKKVSSNKQRIKQEKTNAVKKVKKTFFTEKNKKSKKSQSKSKQNIDMSKKGKKPIKLNHSISECSECKRCARAQEKEQPKRKQRNPTTTITMPENQVVQTLLDARCHGDTVSPSTSGDNTPIAVINAILSEPDVNIKNNGLKCLRPTNFVVQYASVDNHDTTEESGRDEVPEPTSESPTSSKAYQRNRAYSLAALDAHLGLSHCPDVKQRKPSRGVFLNYDPIDGYIVGRKRTSEEKSSRGLPVVRRAKSESDVELGPERSRGFGGWVQDSTLFDLIDHVEEPPVTKPLVVEKAKKKNIPENRKREAGRCAQLIKFARKCLCLYEESETDFHTRGGRVGGKGMKKGDVIKTKAKLNSPSKKNLNLTRTTEKEFFDRKRDEHWKNKTRGQRSHVSFLDSKN